MDYDAPYLGSLYMPRIRRLRGGVVPVRGDIGEHVASVRTDRLAFNRFAVLNTAGRLIAYCEAERLRPQHWFASRQWRTWAADGSVIMDVAANLPAGSAEITLANGASLRLEYDWPDPTIRLLNYTDEIALLAPTNWEASDPPAQPHIFVLSQRILSAVQAISVAQCVRQDVRIRSRWRWRPVTAE